MNVNARYALFWMLMLTMNEINALSWMSMLVMLFLNVNAHYEWKLQIDDVF